MSIKYKFLGRHPHVGRSLTPSGVPGQSRLVPRRVYLTQWYPYGVPFESLSLLKKKQAKLQVGSGLGPRRAGVTVQHGDAFPKIYIL